MDFFVNGHEWFTRTVVDGEIPYLVPLPRAGEYLNGIKKATWVERYAEPGEFTIEAKASSGLIDQCPVSTYISHVLSDDMMIVENHEVINEKDKEPTIKISGRSMMSVYGQRQVGSQSAANDPIIGENDIVIPADYLGEQIALFIRHHTHGQVYTPPDIDGVWNQGDDMDWPTYSQASYQGEQIARKIEPGLLLDRVIELLGIADLGVKFERRLDSWGLFIVHNGTDRPNTIFSWDNGDFEQLEYLFSNKSYYTAAFVHGSKLWVNVNGTPETSDFGGVLRRTAILDASDIDGFLTTLTTSGQINSIAAKMTTRGEEFIRKQKYTNVTRVEVSPNSNWKYRRDYKIGDTVYISNGLYNELIPMRVVEHAETLDENGVTNIPTLVPIGTGLNLPPT